MAPVSPHLVAPRVDQPASGQPVDQLGLLDHAWRLGVCLLISGILFTSTFEAMRDNHRTLFWIDIALGSIAYPLVVVRHRAPVRIALAIAVLSTFSGIAAGPATLAAVSVATRRHLGEILLVGSVNTICASVYSLVAPYGMKDDEIVYGLAATLAINVAMMGWGSFLGSSRELVHSRRRREAERREEQERRVTQARTTERSRIAREMHDVLAHRITQVSMGAGALAFRQDLDADRLRAGLGEIQEQANSALDELRSILGVLRDDAGELVERPQPTLDDLPDLLEQARRAETHVLVRNEIDQAAQVPAPAGRTLYRIVQEGITNARRHAPGETLEVHLSGDSGRGLTVRLRNRLPAGHAASAGSGLGLLGLRERAELRGGRLASVRDGEHFEVEGWIPWT